jgi:hypothetical protein
MSGCHALRAAVGLAVCTVLLALLPVSTVAAQARDRTPPTKPTNLRVTSTSRASDNAGLEPVHR